MDLNKAVVLGNGYIGSAFANAGLPCIDSSKFRYKGSAFNYESNFLLLIPLLEDYDIIINCMGWTDTRTSELPENFKEVYYINALFVHELSQYCEENDKKLIHISSGDIYGNVSDIADVTSGSVIQKAYEQTIESTKKFDIETNYRFSKVAGDKFCNPKDLILRIRLPFDGRKHPKNLIYKARNFTKFYHFQNTFTYVPDLINATQVLIDNNQTGVFNIAQYEPASILYLMRNILQLPHLQNIDIHDKNDPNLITEYNMINIHNDMNTDKLREFYKPINLDAAWKVSWEQLNG